MDEALGLAEQFEQNRGRLRAVAYRMLGTLAEADDAVQEAWLRLNRTDTGEINNLGGWLTTVVARVCLDILRSRQSRREDPLELTSDPAQHPAARHASLPSPEQEALMADSVGIALLVVLERLTPAERLAFVLHDTFDLSFDEIAAIIGRSPDATRQLASRARRRVRGTSDSFDPGIREQKRLVEAFIRALRAGDIESLISVLDPDLEVKADLGALPKGAIGLRGARAWAQQAVTAARGAVFARVALIDGAVGIVIAPRGRLFRAIKLTFAGDRITQIDLVADPERLQRLDLATVPE